jgi:hypothetical protein
MLVGASLGSVSLTSLWVMAVPVSVHVKKKREKKKIKTGSLGLALYS